jgi:DinB family
MPLHDVPLGAAGYSSDGYDPDIQQRETYGIQSIVQEGAGIMKNAREYFGECFSAERPKFMRVIKAVPPDQAAYRPHPRSTCAGDLVWLLASELRDACDLIDRGEVTFVARPAPVVSESVAAYEKNAEDFEKRLTTLDDPRWDATARFLVDGNVAWETSLGDMLFGFLFDAIHHRGQLSSYLRPMGAKVPSIYGPSADDPGM